MIEDFSLNQLQDAQAPLFQTKLTSQELQIAVNFLKRRFPHVPIHKTICTLQNYYSNGKYSLPARQQPNIEEKKPIKKYMKNTENQEVIKISAQQKKMRESQNICLVSRLFCENGDDFNLVKRYIPDLTTSNYRNILSNIVTKVIKDMVTFLKKDCGIKIIDLSQNQILIIKSSLIHAREWMGLYDIQALQTFLKFISKRFLKRPKEISKKQCIRLFNIIARRVNDNSIHIQQEFNQNSYTKQKSKNYQVENMISTKSQQQIEQLIIQIYLQQLSICRTSQKLIQNYGIMNKFQQNSIFSIIKQKITKALKKIKGNIINFPTKKIKLEQLKINEQFILQISKQENMKIQYNILSFYKQKHIELKKQTKVLFYNIILQLNQFISKFRKNYPQLNFNSIQSEEILQSFQEQNKYKQINKSTCNNIIQDIFEIDNQQIFQLQKIEKINKKNTNKNKNNQITDINYKNNNKIHIFQDD